MSTRSEEETRIRGGVPQGAGRGRPRADRAHEVALVSRARRDLLLRAHRYRLRWEDLEDCYSQATLELVAHAQRGGLPADRAHLVNLLEQRFVSRIRDRRRAISGRSPMHAALEASISLGGGEDAADAVDPRADVEQLVLLRHDLGVIVRLAPGLSSDQRLVLVCQLVPMSRGETCSSLGWSAEKYRKVAQRARTRLRALMEAEERG